MPEWCHGAVPAAIRVAVLLPGGRREPAWRPRSGRTSSCRRAARSRRSSRAEPTRPASGTSSARSATGSPRSTSTTACAAASPTRTRGSAARCSAPRWSTGGAARPRTSCARSVTPSRPTRLRATGHTASDQVETVLYRLVSRGAASGIEAKRADGVVRPLLDVDARGDRGLLRSGRARVSHRQLEPGHEARPDPRADLAAPGRAPSRRRAEPPLAPRRGRLAARAPRRHRCDAPARPRRRRERRPGIRLGLARALGHARSTARWPGEAGGSAPSEKGLKVRGWRPGDRLAGRGRKIQDVFVDAKIPRSQREAWPLVVRGDEVVAVPGIVDAPGVKAERVAG